MLPSRVMKARILISKPTERAGTEQFWPKYNHRSTLHDYEKGGSCSMFRTLLLLKEVHIKEEILPQPFLLTTTDKTINCHSNFT